MTIINNSFKFIFIHVPKAAGTTLTSVLAPYTNYCDIEIGGTNFGEQIQPAYKKRFGLTKHSTAAEIRNMVGAVIWSQYFTFAFVRNPFARCLSTFHFLKKWEGLNEEFATKMNLFKSFDEYVLSDIWLETNGPDDIFRPQLYWLRLPNKNNMLVDFVGKVEQIDKDIKYVTDVIGCSKRNELLTIPQLNISKQASITDITNDAVIEKIVQKYMIDFETFGYPLEPHFTSDLTGTKKRKRP
ncbi:sulfotransferase family protein [Nitrosomonas communis]|uniref:sulfotransferase family protein n=1 Tax=Nitrosomonas communis TaxID=44574 RepID=UPI003D2E7A51